MVEIALRAFALKPRVFLDRRHWFNAVDLAIVGATFAVSVAYVAVVDAAVDGGAFENEDGERDSFIFFSNRGRKKKRHFFNLLERGGQLL